jgi:hypothetical protein
MATLNTVTNTYKVGRGSLLFNRRRDDGTYEGFRRLGNAPGFTVSVESENITHESSESGLAERDLDTLLRLTRTGTITLDNLSADNLAIFLGADASTVTQASSPVTGEAITKVRSDRAYQLGTTLVGVRNVSSVTVTVSATARANSTAYTVGQIYVPATPNNHLYICTVAGTSAASPPTFTTDGTTFTDGTATFKDVGTINSLTAGTDYLLDATLGLVSIPTTGKIATAYANALAAVTSGDFSLNLAVDYTPAATTWAQVATGAASAVRGRLHFVSNNPIGSQEDILIPDATLAPNGELPFITADEVAAVELTVGINKLDSNTAALYVNGRPV